MAFISRVRTATTQLAEKLRHDGIDVLYIGGYGPDAGLILKTVRAVGDDLQLIGGDALGMDEFWAVASNAGEGSIFSARPEAGIDSGIGRLLERLQGREQSARTGGLGAYAAVQVWAQAVQRVGKTDFDAVVKALHYGRFTTVLGQISFDGKGDMQDAQWQWKVWSNGAHPPLPIESVSPTN